MYMFVYPTGEQFILLLGFMFPPLLILVLTVISLATFGKSFGIREMYVNSLLKIFEWAAGEIYSAKKQEKLFVAGDDDLDEEDTQTDDDDSFILSDYASDASIPSIESYFKSDSGTSCAEENHLRRRTASAQSIIVRSTDMNKIDELEDDIVSGRGRAVLDDAVYFLKAGIETIVEDTVTCRFEAEQLACWNMMTRTSHIWCEFISWKLNILYFLGFIFRYCFLLPLRLVIFLIGLIFLVMSTAALGLLSDGKVKRYLNEKCMLTSFRVLSRCLTAVIYFHDQHNKAKNGGVCVANHTSPIDVLILNTDHCYALIGQRHTDLLGFIQRALSRATNHIWFERSESRDRYIVAEALKNHAQDPNNLPVLIFPEGTCINNTSVMQFRKGSFETNQIVYPIAMKYDPRFGDAFWNSSRQGWFQYLVEMMSSWAIICHVWYLPPMQKLPDEDAIQFANRVKKTIAIRGGLIDLEWDGQLKRSRVSENMVNKTRDKYYKRLSRYTSTCEVVN